MELFIASPTLGRETEHKASGCGDEGNSRLCEVSTVVEWLSRKRRFSMALCVKKQTCDMRGGRRRREEKQEGERGQRRGERRGKQEGGEGKGDRKGIIEEGEEGGGA